MQMLAKVRQELATEIGQQATQLNEQILLEQRRANDKERQILDLGERLRVAQESAQRSALDAERALQAAKQQGLMAKQARMELTDVRAEIATQAGAAAEWVRAYIGLYIPGVCRGGLKCTARCTFERHCAHSD